FSSPVRSPLPSRSTYRTSPSKASQTFVLACGPNTRRQYLGFAWYLGSLAMVRSSLDRSAAVAGAEQNKSISSKRKNLISLLLVMVPGCGTVKDCHHHGSHLAKPANSSVRTERGPFFWSG